LAASLEGSGWGCTFCLRDCTYFWTFLLLFLFLSPKVLSSTIFCFFAKSTFDCCFGGISYLHPNRYNSHSLASESAFDYAGDGESDDTGGVASICWWRARGGGGGCVRFCLVFWTETLPTGGGDSRRYVWLWIDRSVLGLSHAWRIMVGNGAIFFRAT